MLVCVIIEFVCRCHLIAPSAESCFGTFGEAQDGVRAYQKGHGRKSLGRSTFLRRQRFPFNAGLIPMNQIIIPQRPPFTIYSDPRFRRIDDAHWLYWATIDTITIGIILATYNAEFNAYAINKEEFRRLIIALEAGKIVEGAAETVRFDFDSKTYVYAEMVEAGWLWKRPRTCLPGWVSSENFGACRAFPVKGRCEHWQR
jgi:hypothetical protein